MVKQEVFITKLENIVVENSFKTLFCRVKYCSLMLTESIQLPAVGLYRIVYRLKFIAV